jgi:hypothetical protein
MHYDFLNRKYDHRAINFAAMNGHLNCFIWLYKHISKKDIYEIINRAIFGGRGNILKWIIENVNHIDKHVIVLQLLLNDKFNAVRYLLDINLSNEQLDEIKKSLDISDRWDNFDNYYPHCCYTCACNNC